MPVVRVRYSRTCVGQKVRYDEYRASIVDDVDVDVDEESKDKRRPIKDVPPVVEETCRSCRHGQATDPILLVQLSELSILDRR